MHVDARITSKNQITLPLAVRERLGVGSGGRVRFQIDKDGTVRVEPRRASLEDIRGIIKVPDHLRDLSWEEIRQMTHDARDGRAEHHLEAMAEARRTKADG